MLQLLRPNSLNLPCLYSTFHLEYPLVLSRFCFVIWQGQPCSHAFHESLILGLAKAPIVETKFLELAMSLLDFSPRIPLGTFSILLRNLTRSAMFACLSWVNDSEEQTSTKMCETKIYPSVLPFIACVIHNCACAPHFSIYAAIFNIHCFFFPLVYIQLSFFVYITCKWKCAISYQTRPRAGFTWSGTVFSLVTKAGKLNRELLL